MINFKDHGFLIYPNSFRISDQYISWMIQIAQMKLYYFWDTLDVPF